MSDPHVVQVMGIINVTPDSFSDGGRWSDVDDAIAHGRDLAAEGAQVLDVGGESTRPGAVEVSVDEEIARVVPVIEALSTTARISIDTRKAEVARAAIGAGATLINDVSASLWPVAAECRVGWIAMHMQGEPGTMQRRPEYENVVTEVRDFLVDRARSATDAGVEEVWIDPGFGFGKADDHNLQLLQNLEFLTATGYAVAVGLSRKSILGRLTASADVVPGPDDREEASLAAAVWAMSKGAAMIRVHDVKAAIRAGRVVAAIQSSRKIEEQAA